MARLHDWLELGRSTFRSITGRDMAGLYALEWPETKKMLIADHRAAIETEPRAVKRWARTWSAVLYGLTKRLAPHRRLLFLVSFIAFFVCLVSIFGSMEKPPFLTFVEVTATFLIMTVLLAMELIDKIKFRDELALARDLQASLVPAQLPQTESFDLAAFNSIANTVGGDIYDFVPLPDGRLAVLFGDASGHGMAAGLVMAVAHASFRTQLEVDPAPEAISASLNRILCRTGGSRSFFSSCYLLLSSDGTFEMTLAGHPPPLKIDQTGRVVARLGRGAYPLGVKSGAKWEVITDSIAPGQALLLHSDGLTEARNRSDQDFGDDFLDNIVSRQPPSSADAVINAVMNRWRAFVGDTRVEDDVSLAVIHHRHASPSNT